MRNYVVCHYEKCYGPPVSYTTHIERRKADGSEHIPYNIKRSDLTRHNREFIAETRKIGRTAAIEKRLMAVKRQKDNEGNEYERKIRKDQVCCIEIRLSASPEAMAEIIAQGRLMEWCRESVKWAQREHGKENIVSAVLHMDEETPHLHVSLVPVVQGESKKQATTKKRAAKDKEKAESEGTELPKKKRRYKKKADTSTLRLCADDIMTRGGLKRYQTEYAAAMEQFGLRRGEENSPARHKDLAEYYKEHCEEMHARLDEVLSDLAKVERLVEDKDTEIRHRDDIIRRKEDEISQRDFELEKKDREIARQQRTLEELLPRIEKEQGRFDTLFTANEYLEGMELSADRLLEAYDSRESEVAKIESSSPQSTLIISELKNKYPKKYPKRLFRVLFLSLLTSCANVGGSKRTAPRKRPLMLRSSPSPKSRGSAFLFPRSWFCPWSWCRRLRRLCFGCRLWRTFGLRLSFRIRAVSRR